MASENNNEFKGTDKKSISRREFLKIGATSAAGLAATSAVPALAESSAKRAPARRYQSGSPTVVRLWSWYIEQQDQFPKVISDFEADHPNIKIDYQLMTGDASAVYLPALLAAAASGNIADMPEIYAPHVHSVEFGRKGIALDLMAALGKDWLADFFPSANSMFVDGDALYAVGWMAQTLGIFYDPDMFTQAGIDGEPETWDDLITASNQIKSAIPGNLGIMMSASDGFTVGDLWFPMISDYSNDAATLKQLDDHVIPWTSQPVVDSLTLYKKTLDGNCWQNGATGMVQADCLNALYAGIGAGFYSGSWQPVSLYKNAPPELMQRLKVMKTPTVSAGGRHWTGNSAGAAFSVANGPNKDAALEFFKYMYSPDVYAWIMSNSVSLPATQGAAAQVTDPFIKTMASWLPDGCRHWLTGPAGQAVADAISQFTQSPDDPQATAQAMEDGASQVQPLATATASS